MPISLPIPATISTLTPAVAGLTRLSFLRLLVATTFPSVLCRKKTTRFSSKPLVKVCVHLLSLSLSLSPSLSLSLPPLPAMYSPRSPCISYFSLSTDWPLIGNFYKSCNNMEKRNSLGLSPMKSIFSAIDAATSKGNNTAALATLAARFFNNGWSVFFALDITTANPTKPSQYLPSLAQGGMGLPAPSMYTGKGNSTKAVLAQYVTHIQKLVNISNAAAAAVVDFETQLAQVSLAPSQQTPKGTDNPTSTSDVTNMLNPGFDFTTFLTAAQLDGVTEFNVMEPKFFKALSSIISKASPTVLNNYLRFHALHASAKLLTEDIQNLNFEFYDKVLSGSTQQSPQNETCLNQVNSYMPFLLSHYFIQKAFSPDIRTDAETLLAYVLNAFKGNLEKVPWMDNSTRQVAVGKLEAMTKRIGYPDVWPSYDGVELAQDALLSNSLVLSQHTIAINRARLSGPVDKNVWYMYPAMVNAYYDPSTNSINFPAGILQIPFFNATRPASVNFGQIGAVMGHEMTHGFDNNGAQYDKTGALKDWWPKSVVKAFENKTSCVVQQYNKYEPIPGFFINGEQTLGENIADLGAVKNAYGAHRQWIKDGKNKFSEGDISAAFQGLNSDQVFFLAYAQNWCEISTPSFLQSDLQTNPHSPGPYRVRGPLTDFPEFATAFQCKQGDNYFPPNKVQPARCEVW
eukprot:TRINITY_DN295_c0_g1_i3.p1 TRINITY_DN295_c0_g1~~TRINITY_DN295_c0_g1_i3.p1  ORF type:complete len:685 (-),score=200.13 TRINITY_DN295_c0_g1_i3:84-2138(-)